MFATVHNLFAFSLIFVFFKALPSWGFSFVQETQQKYLDRAVQMQLWKDQRWLQLGHYEGGKSSFRGPLFIHKHGYDSPEDELRATVVAFFSESKELSEKYKMHPQCRFLARRKWLTQKLDIQKDDLLPCEDRQNWKKQLNAKAVSLIFAASDLGNPSSSYGHTFLKLINPDNANNKDLIDYGINYAADADQSEGFFYAVKGILGMYGGTFTMLPYHQKLREYINLEGRDIWEYPLRFTAEEVDFLVDHILEVENSYAPYYFFSDNCSYELLKILEVTRPGLQLSRHLTSFVIPIDTVKVVRRYSDLSVDRIYKKSLKTDYVEGFSKLNSSQKESLDEAVEKNKISSNSLSLQEKAEVYETAMKYYAVKAYRTGKDFDEVLYQLSSERAVLGSVTVEQEIESIQPPDQSHDSSAIYLGRGRTYYAFKVRGAFHDLEQPDFGTVHMSQTEMAVLDFRYDDQLHKFSLNRFTFLDLINLNPSNQLDRNVSWKVRAELFDRWTPDFEVGGGASYDIFKETRIGYFLTSELKGGQYKALGPEILALSRVYPSIGISFSLAYFGVLEERPFLRWKSKLNWNLQPNFDLQFEGYNQPHADDEVQVSFVKNFLF